MSRGTFAILLMVVVAVSLAGFAVWYNHWRSRGAIELWGSAVADQISQAPQCEAIKMSPTGDGVLSAPQPGQDSAARRDVTKARGFSNIRRAFVEDFTFERFGTPTECVPVWQYALRFSSDGGTPTVQLDYAPNCGCVRVEEIGATAIVRPEFAKVLDGFFRETFDGTEVLAAD